MPAFPNPRYFLQGDQKSRLLLRPSAGGFGLVAEITVSRRTATSLRTQDALFRALPDYDADPDTYERAAEAAVALAAPVLVDAIRTSLSSPNRLPAMVIVRGLQQTGGAVATPTDGVVDQRAVAFEAGVLAGVIRHFGLGGTAYATENAGRLLRAVCPVRRDDGRATSQGASTDLNSHVDNYNNRMAGTDDVHPRRYPLMNSHQFFTTITPDPAVPMRVRINDDVFARFDPRGGDPARLAEFRRLYEARYSFASPPSHGEVAWTSGLPVLALRDDARNGPAMRLHTDTTRGDTPAATEALELLKHAVRITPEEVVHTARGDILGYLNTAATHRRERFSARFDGTDRYYLRLYANPREEIERWQAHQGVSGRVM